MIACRKTVVLVHDFDVTKNKEMPMHAFVKIVVGRNDMQEERTFIRTLANLKSYLRRGFGTS